MNIIDKFMDMAEGKQTKIGIGLGGENLHDLNIIKALENFLENNDSLIYIYGNKQVYSQVKKEINNFKDKGHLIFIESEEPEKQIINNLKRSNINAVIRGSLPSSKFLNTIKDLLNVSEIHRLTLLETVDGFQFFYGPVGIDECNTFEKKRDFILKSKAIFELLKITLNVSILSGGRQGDVGRDETVDNSIKLANNVVEFFKKEYPTIIIAHDEILIEKAIEKKANLIIAPDGISGNLIYRTLVHLGGGKAYGAIYLDANYTIIDTSRVGNISEITGALYLALALTN